MFGRKKKREKDAVMTVIAFDVVVEGSILGKKGIRVDGAVNGAVHTRESVIVGNRACVRQRRSQKCGNSSY